MKKVVVEVEVPGELSDMEPLLRDAIRRLVLYLILEAKGRADLSDEEIAEMAREARRKVWERVKNAYTRS